MIALLINKSYFPFLFVHSEKETDAHGSSDTQADFNARTYHEWTIGTKEKVLLVSKTLLAVLVSLGVLIFGIVIRTLWCAKVRNSGVVHWCMYKKNT